MRQLLHGHEAHALRIVGDGLAQGDVVVTAGVQKLLPGQKVALMDASTVQ